AGGVIGGNGNATIQAAGLTNSGTITIAQGLNAKVTGTLDNSHGNLSGTTLTASASTLKNAQGTISGNSVALTVPQLENSGGQIATNQLSVHATNLTNEGGTLTQLGGGAMTMDVSNAIDNSHSGTIQSNSADMTLAPATLNNNAGTITHAGTGTLTINANHGSGALSNVNGHIEGNGQI
ncbi:hypothetical protein CIW54_28995, partial [Paraburkholderia sp. T12-10]